MKPIVIPWLATFLFGCAVFLIGKWFQSDERKKREMKKAEMARAAALAKATEQINRREQQGGLGISLAMLGGKGQQSQERGPIH